jgi:hypothetical protein
MMAWLIIGLVFGLALILYGRRSRRSRGLGNGRTLDLDTRTLYSARYRLAGRPDRIIEGGIPEEWKSSLRVHKSHIAQLAVSSKIKIAIDYRNSQESGYGVLSECNMLPIIYY